MTWFPNSVHIHISHSCHSKMRNIKQNLSRESPWVSYRDMVGPKIEVVVSSSGGVMTTALLDWLKKYKNTNDLGNADHLKHALYPPVSTNPDLRLVYIFDNPILVVLSLFRKNSSLKTKSNAALREIRRPVRLKSRLNSLLRKFWRVLNKRGPPLVVKHYRLMSRKHARFFQDKQLRRDLGSLEAYLRSDFGALPLHQQFHNWRTQPTLHPILFVRASTIWDHLDTLQSFLDLPEESIKEFPHETERISKLKNLGLPAQEKLEQLYGDFAEEIRRMPDVDIRPVTWFTRTPD